MGSQITYYEESGKQIFSLKGEFTRETTLDYAGHIVPYLKEGTEVYLDLFGITKVDSVFIANLVLMQRALRGIPLHLLNASPQVRGLIRISRLETILNLVDPVEESHKAA